MVSAIIIANQFIERAKRDGVVLTNMQLQKLVYIAHAWALALDQGLIYEPVEAWLWGPVIPSLFHNLGRYGAGEVTSPIPILNAQKIGPFDHQRDRYLPNRRKMAIPRLKSNPHKNLNRLQPYLGAQLHGYIRAFVYTS